MPHPPNPAFLDPSAIVRVAEAAEAAGFAAIAFTEHPAPSHRWLTAGGHEAFDPLVALAFCASVTKRLRLMPFLLVLPYHQPFLLAKSTASLDVLSGGRLIVVAGAGYMKSEFRALGVGFEERNELVEQSIRVMRAAWTTETLDWSGPNFAARGITARPHPVQAGGPPIWLGGNSVTTQRRVAALADGWSPNMYDEQTARTTRTAVLATLSDVARGINAIAAWRAEHRRTEPFDVQLLGPHGRRPPTGSDVREHLDVLGQAAGIGVTSTVVQPPHDSVEATLDFIAGYGTEVIAQATQ
jgi:probable F420-dependent oxidoreductase